ncbi:PrgI family protein [Candidatus Giovannonibacteria bacterium]|nr:PrgI family protein [Candidatus Giovannonibacteria bacterium]
MRQFQVPQFIEVEDKIFGPLTLKQFLYVLGGGALIFLLWVFLPFWLAFILALPVGAFFLGLAFYEVNGQPMVKMLENALDHYSNARLYIWKKIDRPRPKENSPQKKAPEYLPKLTESKLKELAWSLDIQNKNSR